MGTTIIMTEHNLPAAVVWEPMQHCWSNGDAFVTAAFLSSSLDLYHFWAAFCLINATAYCHYFL
jgi:hypothetical protein